MAFLGGVAGGLLSGGLGYLGQQQANNATINAQSNAQNQAQAFSANQTAAAKQSQQQALQAALANLSQYQQANPSPISQLGAIQGPPQGGQASFGGGVSGSQAPQGQMQRPQMPQGMPQGQPQMPPQNLQGAMRPQQPQMPQQPQQPQSPQPGQRLQQLYPLVQQMLGGQKAPQPMTRAPGQ